jgi:small subunit ribosomal protein S17e
VPARCTAHALRAPAGRSGGRRPGNPRAAEPPPAARSELARPRSGSLDGGGARVATGLSRQLWLWLAQRLWRSAPRGHAARCSPWLTLLAPQASKAIIENYYSRLTLDFATNKRIAEEVAIIPTKRLRNKIAGFTTHVMKRIQRGPVRGISLKLQEEERERRMDFVPDQSAINTDVIEVDRDSMEMLRSLGCAQLPGLVLTQPQQQGGGGFNKGGDRDSRPRRS